MVYAKAGLAALVLALSVFGGSNLMAHKIAPVDSEITAPGPKGDLAGTMITPADGKPVVLIIPGSGPTDRDGNNPLGVQAATYRLLAEALAERGIGSVRIDKRGMFGSAAAIPDATAVTIADYVADIRSWSEVARAQTGAGCIWLAGHSEGGIVALAAADKVKNICGLILIATPGRSTGDILREQLQANPANAPILPDALAAIEALENGERVDISEMHPALGALFASQVQGFLIDLMAQNPAALAAATDLPMLIFQGEADLQVSTKDADALHGTQPDSTLLLLPGVNHVLKSVQGDDRAANLASYADPDLPLAPGVAEAVVQFMLANTAEQ